LTVYFQGFFKDFGFNNIYDPWDSFFLNMDNGNQLYKLIQCETTELGIKSDIYCYCHHHKTWEKVFLFYRTPSKFKLISRFTLCTSNSSFIYYKKILFEFSIKDKILEESLGDKAMLRELGNLKKKNTNKNIPDLKVEIFLLELLLKINSKEIKFYSINENILKKYIGNN
jgi:hypothetical protein